jgi:hypothetical protein
LPTPKITVFQSCGVAIAVLLSLAVSIKTLRAEQVPCIAASSAREKPQVLPPGPPPGLRAGGQDDLAALRPKPACPEGQVPDVKGIDPNGPGHMKKGNPLLRPGARTPAQDRSAVTLSPFLSFEEVYGPGQKPFRMNSTGSCDGISYEPGAGCYYYASAALRKTVYGGGMVLSIHRPEYVRVGGRGHSLAELSIQGGGNDGDIVEVGWNVSTDDYGDANPHLFVFHWIGGAGTCYDACGWQQVSNVYFPGQSLSTLVGKQVSIGYALINGDWWAWFDNQWLGYFPGSQWSTPFDKASLTQWFGEVVSDNGVPPQTQMGAGAFPARAEAARMFGLCSILENGGACLSSEDYFIVVAPPQASRYYGITRTDASTIRYGGPGK